MLDKPATKAAFLRKLKESALTADDVPSLGFVLLTAEEVAARPKLNGLTERPAAGFVIPYYDRARNYTEFYRFRYLEQPLRNGFSALTESKPLRYTQPAGTRPQVYFSPLFDWEDYFKRKAEERWLLITEGELKANCACKLGLPCVALGGVWNFRSAREGLPVIPDLAELPLKGSNLYIVYDSDAVSNPDVLRAENQLAKQLLKLEARPLVLRLPALRKEGKTGLDDYLVRKGKDRFTKLLPTAEEWAAAQALHTLNEEVMFLRESSTVLDLEKRHRWRSTEFVNAVYANHKYTVTEYKKKEPVLVEKYTAREWLKWGGRAQLEGVTYRPGSPLIVGQEYNCWRGWGVDAATVRRGSVEPWRGLLEFLFAGHPTEYRKWFEQWLAYPLQNPGVKLFTAAVLWGAPGTGKTLIGHTMSRIYGSNYTEVNERELHSSFNEWAEYKQFALGDEITGGDKRGVADFLKGIITQKYLRINPKHIKPYTVPDCINWLFTSNHCDAFFVEDEDRRYFIIEVMQLAREREFYRAYDGWFRSDEGIGALFYHLLHLDLAGFDPMDAAPTTGSKEEMIGDVRSEVASWCVALRENPDSVLKDSGGTVISRSLWTTRELYQLYSLVHNGPTRLTENGLGRELKRARFRKALGGEPLRVSQGLVKLWLIRDREHLAALKAPSAYAKLYEQERPAEAAWNKATEARKKKY